MVGSSKLCGGSVQQEEFAELFGPYRTELHVHCYRLTGSVQDADDAMQETMLAAWRGIGGFQSPDALYRIATHACLRLLHGRPPRLLPPDHGPAKGPDAEL